MICVWVHMSCTQLHNSKIMFLTFRSSENSKTSTFFNRYICDKLRLVNA